MQKVRTKAQVRARNWPAYDLYRKDEEMLFLERAKQVDMKIEYVSLTQQSFLNAKILY